MKPVMLATDGSPTAEQAAETAIELARLLGTELLIATVWNIPTRPWVSPPRCLAAEKYSPHFLVVGSHGWSAVKRALFGSVSTGVLHHAACPVLVVRGEPARQAAAVNGVRTHAHV